MLRAFLWVILVSTLISPSYCQLDEANTEGSSYPEAVPVTSGPGALSGISGPAPNPFQVVAVASNEYQSAYDFAGSSESGSAKAGRPGSGVTRTGSSSSSAPGSGLRSKRRDHGSSSSLNRSSSLSSSSTKETRKQGQAAGPLAGTLHTAIRPQDHPAAAAPLASATPLFGSPAAGTVIPGRYVVFFHHNVSSNKVGLNK